MIGTRFVLGLMLRFAPKSGLGCLRALVVQSGIVMGFGVGSRIVLWFRLTSISGIKIGACPGCLLAQARNTLMGWDRFMDLNEYEVQSIYRVPLRIGADVGMEPSLGKY
ncbi:hypothetical protein Peur_000561 [Populus x canadensis]